MATVESKPISARDAAQKAQAYMAELLPEAKNVMLEEVELTQEGWLITLGFDSRNGMTPLDIMIHSPLTARCRDYKQFLVDKDTGEIRSMKIRVVK